MKIVSLSLNAESGAHAVGYLHDPSGEMPQRKKRPCVVVCPGGGYEFLSDRETDPPATEFFAKGYQVFILYYSVGKYAGELNPQIEAARTLLEIRERSEEWNVRPDQIAICGFSAGGHVAASLGTLWDSPELKAKLGTEGGEKIRPDAMILCYPVITAGDFTHSGSARNIAGGEPTPEQIKFFSLENQVTEKTPPAFLWHTFADETVPLENTLLFVSALRKNQVPFECHIFPNGRHGLSVCNEEVGTPDARNANWVPLCLGWLSDLFHFVY